ncbi:hypothetical protein BJX99DRAFT_167131 [Aspergillus californicus]
MLCDHNRNCRTEKKLQSCELLEGVWVLIAVIGAILTHCLYLGPPFEYFAFFLIKTLRTSKHYSETRSLSFLFAFPLLIPFYFFFLHSPLPQPNAIRVFTADFQVSATPSPLQLPQLSIFFSIDSSHSLKLSPSSRFSHLYHTFIWRYSCLNLPRQSIRQDYCALSDHNLSLIPIAPPRCPTLRVPQLIGTTTYDRSSNCDSPMINCLSSRITILIYSPTSAFLAEDKGASTNRENF